MDRVRVPGPISEAALNLNEKRLLLDDCVMLDRVKLNGLPDKITRHPHCRAGGSADQ